MRIALYDWLVPSYWQIASGCVTVTETAGQPVNGIGTMFAPPTYDASCAAGTVSIEYGAEAFPVARQIVTGFVTSAVGHPLVGAGMMLPWFRYAPRSFELTVSWA